jgi:hypothetical protein
VLFHFIRIQKKNVKSCFLRSRPRQEEIHDVIQAGREDRKKKKKKKTYKETDNDREVQV